MAWAHLVACMELVLDMRTLGLRSDHVGGVDLEEHMA
jgi:hypothetical protein